MTNLANTLEGKAKSALSAVINKCERQSSFLYYEEVIQELLERRVCDPHDPRLVLPSLHALPLLRHIYEVNVKLERPRGLPSPDTSMRKSAENG
eukprot:gene9768-10803_t